MDYIKRESIEKILADACEECRDGCIEFDGFYADCDQCLLDGVKKKLAVISEEEIKIQQHDYYLRRKKKREEKDKNELD